MYNISYIRGLFPDKYYQEKHVPALEMKIKKLVPMDDESKRLVDWMEKGEEVEAAHGSWLSFPSSAAFLGATGLQTHARAQCSCMPHPRVLAGVYDALQRKYLKTMVFAICEEDATSLLEEYTFSFSYGAEDGACNLELQAGGKTRLKAGNDITPLQMK